MNSVPCRTNSGGDPPTPAAPYAPAANCGATQNLLKCSRCHTVWFCDFKCQKVIAVTPAAITAPTCHAQLCQSIAAHHPQASPPTAPCLLDFVQVIKTVAHCCHCSVLLVWLLQAYWPFHKTQCRRNEFADAIEEQEPKFARWMRKHGKLAVLKDDEVDRLERAAAAASGPGRQVRCGLV